MEKKLRVGGGGVYVIGKEGDFAIVMLGFCLCDWSFELFVC